VIDVARVRVGAGLEEQVGDLARPREVQRRLSVATALVHARGIRGEHGGEQVDPIEIRCRACVGDCTGGHEVIRGGTARTVKWMKSPCPPAALSIGIGAELEQHIDHINMLARHRHERRRIESENGRVDVRTNFF